MDYQRMEKVLAWLADNWRAHPSLEEAAELAGLSPTHFQRIFTRWAGVSPKTFVAAIAHAEARRALEDGATVLDAAYDAGLSGPSRLHDLFIAQESATPGDVRRRGAGLTLHYGHAPTPFGPALFAATERGLAGLGFEVTSGTSALQDMQSRWPLAHWVHDDDYVRPYVERAFGAGTGDPIPIDLIGSPFHIQVWKALLAIPPGETVNYGHIARAVGKPRAYQATGSAIGANPISWLIPCHRVIASDGRLAGYHWGLERKAAMLGIEAVDSQLGRQIA
jgi:AraC family transcriptional regulator of adaptative response/methylated-DNA-[protein]-cysteine methyltransferase